MPSSPQTRSRNLTASRFRTRFRPGVQLRATSSSSRFSRTVLSSTNSMYTRKERTCLAESPLRLCAGASDCFSLPLKHSSAKSQMQIPL
ncbi:hypothetical protein ACFX1X_034942 [Malus domestica]